MSYAGSIPRVHERAPVEYLELVYQVFFDSLQRGYRIQEHFPWLTNDCTPGLWTLCIGHPAVMAGLIVREAPNLPAEPRLAAIGLVCVAEPWRGQGLSRALLRAASDHLEKRGFDAVTLWTGKPNVYRGQGFEIDDESRYGWIESPASVASSAIPCLVSRWPDTSERGGLNRGLPPFAQGAWRIQRNSGQSSVVVLHDASGLAVAEWQGPDDEVVALLQSTMPPRWRLNALVGDTLVGALQARGATVQLKPGELQMWRSFRPGRRPWRESPHRWRVLDRI
jgi:GNAT superfamily N-acetyltransferase